MSKVVILVVLIFLSVFISGCGNQKANQSENKSTNDQQKIVNSLQQKDDTPRSTQQNSSTTNNTDNTDNTDATINQPQEIFYGQWVIKKLLAYGPVGTYSNEDIKNIVGRKLSFSKEKASSFGDHIKYLNDVALNPIYEKTVVSKSDFAADYRNRLTFDDLGIKSDSITKINASDSKGKGCVFFIKDNNTLVLSGGGAFFELIREM